MMFKKRIALPLLAALSYASLCLVIAFVGRPVERETRSVARPDGPAATLEEFGTVRWRAEVAVRRQGRLDTFRGTRISPSPSAVGPALRLQHEITQRFEDQDPLPAPRYLHFSWLDEKTFRIRGWDGVIRDLSEGPEGWVVTVSVSPHLSSEKGGIPYTPDYYLETYEYKKARLRFLGGESPADARRAIMID